MCFSLANTQFVKKHGQLKVVGTQLVDVNNEPIVLRGISSDGIVAWQEYIDWMESKKISWITWSVSDKEETCSILKKSAKSNGNWKNKDLKESGIKVRELLRIYNKE
tara:strand:+ start:11398 stop:11718 length:321 start_codon:yes stop_codon:yes gene_type:complete